MEPPIHSLTSLFDQLGLDSSDAAIETFIQCNYPLPEKVELYKADFWNDSQASFLEQVISEDADWTEVVDQLNVSLSKKYS